ncbi:RnfH family protein [Sphaerotilus mobilis]|uniref:UPF0125 protein EV685_0091 n=1 Tax=Sphaerotilus mobilis TaxID=47994 RepID=A0A4Q7LV85_9BURK|nr:RnfH family protein [Sphaerotilus mobilis]RZS57818.1 hypothetical protein EV685_0091 [Sphaerotilus mobilis]
MASADVGAEGGAEGGADSGEEAVDDSGAVSLTIHVVASPAARQTVSVTLSMPVGATVGDAVSRSGLLADHPLLRELASQPSGQTGVIGALTVAVWGRAAAPDRLLDDGDRVEIVRGLQVDPKEARRLRYEVQGDRGRVRRKVGSLKP